MKEGNESELNQSETNVSEEIIDADNDGVLDNIDKCVDSDIPEPVPTQYLRPNHYAQMDEDIIFEVNTGSAKDEVIEDSEYDLVDTYGCTCEQILECKPGNNFGEYKWGCSEGTMNVWVNQLGWSPECQKNGKVVKEGEMKLIWENTDDADLWDVLDNDNDNDGVEDWEDSMIDDADESGKGFGSPDWWEKKRGLK
jgi:hypothetical protein